MTNNDVSTELAAMRESIDRLTAIIEMAFAPRIYSYTPPSEESTKAVKAAMEQMDRTNLLVPRFPNQTLAVEVVGSVECSLPDWTHLGMAGPSIVDTRGRPLEPEDDSEADDALLSPRRLASLYRSVAQLREPTREPSRDVPVLPMRFVKFADADLPVCKDCRKHECECQPTDEGLAMMDFFKGPK